MDNYSDQKQAWFKCAVLRWHVSLKKKQYNCIRFVNEVFLE